MDRMGELLSRSRLDPAGRRAAPVLGAGRNGVWAPAIARCRRWEQDRGVGTRRAEIITVIIGGLLSRDAVPSCGGLFHRTTADV
jgi:hypothetical protein